MTAPQLTIDGNGATLRADDHTVFLWLHSDRHPVLVVADLRDGSFGLLDHYGEPIPLSCLDSTERDVVDVTVRDLTADVRAARSFIASVSRRLGARLDDPEVSLCIPVGRWCYADAKRGVVIVRETPSLLDASTVVVPA